MEIFSFIFITFNGTSVSELFVQTVCCSMKFFLEFRKKVIFQMHHSSLNSTVYPWFNAYFQIFFGKLLKRSMLFNNLIKISKKYIKFCIDIILSDSQVIKVMAVEIYKKFFLVKSCIEVTLIAHHSLRTPSMTWC